LGRDLLDLQLLDGLRPVLLGGRCDKGVEGVVAVAAAVEEAAWRVAAVIV